MTDFQEDLCDAVFCVFTAHVGAPIETDNGPAICPELLAVPWTELTMIRFPRPAPEASGIDLTVIGRLMDAPPTRLRKG